MKAKILGILSLMLLVLATSVFAIGSFKIQQPLGTDIFIVQDDGVVYTDKINITGILNATGATLAFDDDSIAEADISFITTCGSGNRLYIDAGNLACEVAGNTSEEIQDLYGAAVTGNTETGIEVTYDDGDGTLDFIVTGNGTEEITDLVGAMVTGNTETLIAVTFEDADDTLDFVVTDTNTNVTSICSDDEFLLANATCIGYEGNVTSSGIENVVEDTTPELGGSLDLNDFAIDSGDGTTNMTIDGSGNFIIVLS